MLTSIGSFSFGTDSPVSIASLTTADPRSRSASHGYERSRRHPALFPASDALIRQCLLAATQHCSQDLPTIPPAEIHTPAAQVAFDPADHAARRCV